MQWADYQRKRGSVAPLKRMEWSTALIAMLLSRLAGGKREMKDFMPYADDPGSEEVDLQTAMKEWR